MNPVCRMQSRICLSFGSECGIGTVAMSAAASIMEKGFGTDMPDNECSLKNNKRNPRAQQMKTLFSPRVVVEAEVCSSDRVP